MHPNNNQLLSYYDQQLPSREIKQVADHLALCETCQETYHSLISLSAKVNNQLSWLDPTPTEEPIKMEAAKKRLHKQLLIQNQSEAPMSFSKSFWSKLGTIMLRPVYTAGVILLILTLSMLIPSVRATAVNFLGLFRIQQIEVVQFNPANLPHDSFQRSSADFERMLADTVEFDEPGEPQIVSTAEDASDLAGFSVTLPSELDEPSRLSVQSGSTTTIVIDLPRVRALLQEIEREDIELPDELDGATVTIEFPSSVTAAYGDCQFEEAEPHRSRTCTTFVQLPSPTITAPPELDIARIGKAFLQLLGMTPQEAEDFSLKIDWATTLVIPVPLYGTSYENVQINGMEGTLVQYNQEGGNQPEYILMWVKGEIVYALTGPGTLEDAVVIAESLK